MTGQRDDNEETTPLTEPVKSSHQDSFSKGTQLKDGMWVVARCALIASLASVMGGMSGGVTSSALLELSNENQTIATQYFDKESLLPSMFGVITS